MTSPTSTDWIGLYPNSSIAATSYISWRYTTGTASGSVSFPIPAGTAAGTTYQLRFFTNNGFLKRATSNDFTVTPGTTLTVSPTTVAAGGSVTATWSGIGSPTSTDWIGLYPTSGTANTSYISWRYTTGAASGSVSFPIPAGTAAGTTYELRLFSNNGFTRLATGNTFTVTGATLTVSPTTVAAGGSVTATWSGIGSPTSTDWIGLYPNSGTADTSYISWRYTTGAASGSVSFTIPAGTTPGTTYQLRLFSNNGFTRLATGNTFTVQ